MSDEIIHRLSTEGVDSFALAGVNDGNLVELAKRLGVRVSLRGDTLMLQGPLRAVERATPVRRGGGVRRRDFVRGLGGLSVPWPLAPGVFPALAQSPNRVYKALGRV